MRLLVTALIRSDERPAHALLERDPLLSSVFLSALIPPPKAGELGSTLDAIVAGMMQQDSGSEPGPARTSSAWEASL